ncbi:MAG: lysozyme inhibitor LprI family protein [Rhodanobacter sp.]
MRIFLATSVLMAIAPLAVALAQDCSNATSQMAMNVCADQAYRKTDAELNAVYSQINVRLKQDKEATKLLVNAQKAWLAFRDAECTFSTSASAQGSVYPMLVAQCRDGLTSTRIDELKAYLRCEEGDLSCPVPSS